MLSSYPLVQITFSSDELCSFDYPPNRQLLVACVQPYCTVSLVKAWASGAVISNRCSVAMRKENTNFLKTAL